ncbi:hypothetical protein F4803DRAFT_290070 [Xylaria telfairii]|nr:hypothetical protein F4803DRAFT_290070 [Xylaria telfairii]
MLSTYVQTAHLLLAVLTPGRLTCGFSSDPSRRSTCTVPTRFASHNGLQQLEEKGKSRKREGCAWQSHGALIPAVGALEQLVELQSPATDAGALLMLGSSELPC